MMFFLRQLRKRCIWSWAGLVLCWREEHSFRSWVWANVVSAALAIALPLSAAETAVLVMGGVIVLAFECLNTALERIVDDISTDQRDAARQAKDAGSAAVAVSAVAVGIAWIVILLG